MSFANPSGLFLYLMLVIGFPVGGLAQAATPDLPRKAWLGAQVEPSEEGLFVRTVLPLSTAHGMRLRPGDVLTAVDGKPVGSLPQLVEALASSSEGAEMTVRIVRDGRAAELRSRVAGRPREVYSGAAVTYGSVGFRDGHLRDLMVSPDGVADPPVVFLMQGFTCASIEAPDPTETYRRLGQALVDHNIAFYRVEKPQVGDSVGGPSCSTIDFATELDGFRAAYRSLREQRGIAADRIFMLGHSLGGLQAPMLAAEHAPRGVAVFGTVYRNWADYHQNAAMFQSFLHANADPVEAMRMGESSRPVIRRFFLEGETPAEIAKDAQLAPLVREMLDWQGGDIAAGGRHYRFLQSLANLPLAAAWRDTRSQVLSLYGESDLVAVFRTDHELIADVVNHYRPGTARFVELPMTEHDMRHAPARADFRIAAARDGSAPRGPFNAHVASALVSWVREAMAKPPVRCLQPSGDAGAVAGAGCRLPGDMTSCQSLPPSPA